MTENEKISFETAVEGLERCVRELEEGSLTLEETIARYEEGKRYAKICYGLLDQAELRIVELRKEDDGQDGDEE